ncbi:MAG: phytanoyl-CoA dioxygenase [Sphingomonas sp.]|nr:phytanoyl-CoA dioxygenase [Sphingomonas sp.]
MRGALRSLGWLRAPFWVLALFTGAKSFADNPILGSRALNRAGLHVWRLQTAHALARWRRARLARSIPRHLREQFDRDGFIVVTELLPAAEFREVQAAVLGTPFESRIHQQGDTITRRVPLGPEVAARCPALKRLVRGATWRGVMAYVASARTAPLYYVQTVCGGVAEGPPDPQLELHCDTFHPSLKAWFFLTDLEEDGRPLTYVAGSHRLSPERIAWEQRKSIEVMETGDRLSQRGSFRIRPDELPELALPEPTRFCVPANTLVVVDTCGFHARASSHRPTVRVELWAYCRRNPFLPWASAGIFSLQRFAGRRAELLLSGLDWLDRVGLRKQHWTRAGRFRPIDP